MIYCIPHPGSYRLIKQITMPVKATSLKGLFRYPFHKTIPQGYEEVKKLWDNPVYQDNGLLTEKYWALPRFEIKDNPREDT
jgi:hypothetical protein